MWCIKRIDKILKSGIILKECLNLLKAERIQIESKIMRKRSTNYPLPEKVLHEKAVCRVRYADVTWLEENLKEGIRKVAFESEDRTQCD